MLALILPYFLLMALLLVVARIAARIPFYRDLLSQPLPAYPAIEGLRGFLAFGVFFHHAAKVYVEKMQPPDPVAVTFYQLLGQVGVSLFFCITGFLFWGKVIRGQGRIAWKPLYLSRLRRLAPAYLLSVVLVGLVLWWMPGVELERQHSLVTQFFHIASFEGIKSASAINGVYWTLVYEWRFYLVLPLIAWCWRGWGFAALCAATVATGLALPGMWIVILNFVTGAVCAWLHARYRWEKAASTQAASAAIMLLLIALFSTCETAYRPLPILLLAPVFCLLSYGNTLWGLLTLPSARLLGTVSYSVYLLHSIVLFVILTPLAHQLDIPHLPALTFWSWIGLTGVALVMVSALSYRYVEHPFLRVRPIVSAD